jgi:hypothetical protein
LLTISENYWEWRYWHGIVNIMRGLGLIFSWFYFSFSTLVGVSLPLTIVLLLMAKAFIFCSKLLVGYYFYFGHFNKAAMFKC